MVITGISDRIRYAPQCGSHDLSVPVSLRGAMGETGHKFIANQTELLTNDLEF